MMQMPTPAEVIAALPLIGSLVVIEALLSVDNALAVATMASHLAPEQREKALRYGILGAYIFRGAAIAIAAWIVRNEWVKVIGVIYLLYLMSSNLTSEAAGGGATVARKRPGLWITLLQIELMDLSLSLDNVIAAVAMSRRIWVIYAGVFIGILALRFLAGICTRLVARHQVLGQAAFLIVGYVGFLLGWDLATDHESSSLVKFGGICAILTLSLLVEKSPRLRRLLTPLFRVSGLIMKAYATLIDVLAWPIRKPFEIVNSRLEKRCAA